MGRFKRWMCRVIGHKMKLYIKFVNFKPYYYEKCKRCGMFVKRDAGTYMNFKE